MHVDIPHTCMKLTHLGLNWMFAEGVGGVAQQHVSLASGVSAANLSLLVCSITVLSLASGVSAANFSCSLVLFCCNIASFMSGLSIVSGVITLPPFSLFSSAVSATHQALSHSFLHHNRSSLSCNGLRALLQVLWVSMFKTPEGVHVRSICTVSGHVLFSKFCHYPRIAHVKLEEYLIYGMMYAKYRQNHRSTR